MIQSFNIHLNVHWVCVLTVCLLNSCHLTAKSQSVVKPDYQLPNRSISHKTSYFCYSLCNCLLHFFIQTTTSSPYNHSFSITQDMAYDGRHGSGGFTSRLCEQRPLWHHSEKTFPNFKKVKISYHAEHPPIQFLHTSSAASH